MGRGEGASGEGEIGRGGEEGWKGTRARLGTLVGLGLVARVWGRGEECDK